jgi:hypothetical protein
VLQFVEKKAQQGLLYFPQHVASGRGVVHDCDRQHYFATVDIRDGRLCSFQRHLFTVVAVSPKTIPNESTEPNRQAQARTPKEAETRTND